MRWLEYPLPIWTPALIMLASVAAIYGKTGLIAVAVTAMVATAIVTLKERTLLGLYQLFKDEFYNH